MTVPLWSLVVVLFIPQGIAVLGDVYRWRMLGAIDNDDPRGQAERLDGAGARVYAAQANAWEALAMFTVAVFLAHLTGADAGASATAAVLFVVARLLHPVFYITGLSTLRSLSFLVGAGCCIWLIVLAANAPAA